ncbi:hypothetical protein DQ244_07085 [Blastococcus sp. TBT05-19]|uniref:hypothetical protein n=1 Tax=Blastococcus sp. TBT05-19 TaxID=2250581 RepID=UPI000DEB8F1C|nr:hypothetical protein [Blastococcus sp. TBT05-19]RBY92068.1 hypothetical protein DQ244_07085 [Blastococcus sp. TBT05-19]
MGQAAGRSARALLLAAAAVTTGCAADRPQQPTPVAASSSVVADPSAVAVPVDLVTHCGIRTVLLDGRRWEAVQPAPEPARLPDAAGVVTYDGTTAGELVLLDDDELRFTVRDPLSAADGQTYDFRPVPEGAPPEPVCA